MKLPFWMYPAHWGLKGRMLEHAKVDYLIDDEIARETEHLKIDYTGKDLQERILHMKKEKGVLSPTEYEDALIDLIEDPELKAKETLEVLRERGDITEHEYMKEICTRTNIPWFVFDVNYTNGDLYMDSDWNDCFVTMLKEIGYNGQNDDEIVQHYIRDMGHKLAESDYDAEPVDVGYRFIKTSVDGDTKIYE